VFQVLKDAITSGTLHVHVPDGKVRRIGQGDPQAHWIIRDPAVLGRIARDPELQLGETYMEGGWDAGEDGLEPLLLVLMCSFRERRRHGRARLGQIGREVIMRGNRIAFSYRHAAYHYDIDEWLYRRFLDEDMHYSCAFFSRPDMSLEEAQQAKCALLRDKLCLAPGQKVLDIGSGWGGLALYLARHGQVEVDGLTLSKEQLRVARSRAQEQGLEDRVRFHLQDYREHRGEYDRVVSVGMFEHVGRRHFPAFFDRVAKFLRPGGLAVLHTIGSTTPPAPTNAWIARHIFPGGYVPALSELMAAVEGTSLLATDVEVLRLHYADTLAHWLERFRQVRGQVADRMGERFARMWEFYLASTQMTFRCWGTVVFQVQLAKQLDAAPLTRDYLCR
jgi:cyclopropane-fatty-acyl-phospholipid synthase